MPPKFIKGSPEAIAHMAKLRDARQSKKKTSEAPKVTEEPKMIIAPEKVKRTRKPKAV